MTGFEGIDPQAAARFDADPDSRERTTRNLPVRRPLTMEGLLGNAACWVRVFEQLDRIVSVPCPVLLTGPHGSGKHTCARALHRTAHPAGPFVFVDALAHDENVRLRAPRGPVSVHRLPVNSDPERWLQAARGGTLFVSEITELPASLQLFLCDALRQSGSREPRFRLVAASRHSVDALATGRSVRPDFFYQVNVLSCELPTLGHRDADILLLADAFLPPREGDRWQFSAPARKLLLSYPWPGNMNELRSAVQYATAVADGPCLQPSDLPVRVRSLGEGSERALALPEGGINLRQTLERMENDLLQQALERAHWNKQKAARLLGLNRTTLVEMLKRKRLHRASPPF